MQKFIDICLRLGRFMHFIECVLHLNKKGF
jgi:hypothetical protein